MNTQLRIEEFYQFLDQKYKDLSSSDSKFPLIMVINFIKVLMYDYKIEEQSAKEITMNAAGHIINNFRYHSNTSHWDHKEYPHISKCFSSNHLCGIDSEYSPDKYNGIINLLEDFRIFRELYTFWSDAKTINNIDASKHELHSIEELD
jgi:hypothetical protein